MDEQQQQVNSDDVSSLGDVVDSALEAILQIAFNAKEGENGMMDEQSKSAIDAISKMLDDSIQLAKDLGLDVKDEGKEEQQQEGNSNGLKPTDVPKLESTLKVCGTELKGTGIPSTLNAVYKNGKLISDLRKKYL